MFARINLFAFATLLLTAASEVHALDAGASSGNITWELVGGASGAVLGGLASYYATLTPDTMCPSAHVPTPCTFTEKSSILAPLFVLGLVTPALTTAGVMAGGALTDGRGTLGSTLMGTYMGGAAGAILGLIASSLTDHAPSLHVDMRVFAATTALGCGAGALFAYRSSARLARVPRVHALLTQHSALLSVSVAL